jgi:putative transposase
MTSVMSKSDQRLSQQLQPYRRLDRDTLIRLFTVAKPTLDWTSGVPACVFESVFTDLIEALAAFFTARQGRRSDDRSIGFPAFIAAYRQATFATRGAITARDGRVKLPLLPPLKIAGSTRRLERELVKLHGTIKGAAVTGHRGQWWVSLIVEREVRSIAADSSQVVGLDLGLHQFLTRSDGTVVDNPRFLSRNARRLRRLAKAVGRSQAARESSVLLAGIERHAELLEHWDRSGQVGESPVFPTMPLPPKSHRQQKKEQRYARALGRAADARRTFHQQTAATLVPAFAVIGTESLAIANLLKNHSLAGAIADAGWGQFLKSLDTRAEDRGSLIIRADRFLASSQTCSACGTVNPAVKDLDVRVWTCIKPTCGVVHQRDHNAALNLIPSPAQITKAAAARAERHSAYARKRKQIAAKAKMIAASKRQHAAEKQARTQRRADAAMLRPIAITSSISSTAPTPRAPAIPGTSVGSMPEATLNRAWRPGQSEDVSARVEETRTDARRSYPSLGLDSS